MARIIARVLKTILDQLDEDNSSTVTHNKLDEIKDNHLAHVQAEIVTLSGRIGAVEGKLNLLIGFLSLIFATIAAPILIPLIHHALTR